MTGRLARALTSDDVVAALLDHLPAAVGAKSAAVAVDRRRGPPRAAAARARAARRARLEPRRRFGDRRRAGRRASRRGSSPRSGGGATTPPTCSPPAAGRWRCCRSRPTTCAGCWRCPTRGCTPSWTRSAALLETVGVLAARAFARGPALRRRAPRVAGVPAHRPPVRAPGGRRAHRSRRATAPVPCGRRSAATGTTSFDLGDDRVALLVGDVVGHGMDAAVAMGRLRTGFRMIAALAPRARRDGAGRQPAGGGHPERHVLHGAVRRRPPAHRDDGLVPGRPPAPAARARRQRPSCSTRTGVPPLGVAPELRRRSTAEVLAPGDVVVLYTDGVIERRQEIDRRGLRAPAASSARSSPTSAPRTSATPCSRPSCPSRSRPTTSPSSSSATTARDDEDQSAVAEVGVPGSGRSRRRRQRVGPATPVARHPDVLRVGDGVV